MFIFLAKISDRWSKVKPHTKFNPEPSKHFPSDITWDSKKIMIKVFKWAKYLFFHSTENSLMPDAVGALV